MVEKSQIKRKLIQFASMLIYNADVSHWFSGTISKSPLKHGCVPGLNCYSCPGAISSCPLGSLQSTLATGRVPFFITGFLILTGVFFGRTVCSYLCPVGLMQELLNKIPSPKIRRRGLLKKITRKASLTKYILLFVLCLVLPVAMYLKNGISSPFFCKLICPAGTVGAGWTLSVFSESIREAIGSIFLWKTTVAIIFIIWAVFMYRPFCRFFCPLGAIYSFFNKIAIFGIKVDNAKCTNCGACAAGCKMDVLKINDRECIRCGECKSRCHFGAIKF